MADEHDSYLMDHVDDEDTTRDQYLTFETDGEDYGVEIAKVKEIIKKQGYTITKVPYTPDYIEGITNLRGEIVPVIEVRKRFMKTVKEYDDQACIIVMLYEDEKIGLLVDSIKEVLHIDENDVAPPPNAKLNHHNQYIRSIGRVGDQVKLLLDVDRLLAQE